MLNPDRELFFFHVHIKNLNGTELFEKITLVI